MIDIILLSPCAVKDLANVRFSAVPCRSWYRQVFRAKPSSAAASGTFQAIISGLIQFGLGLPLEVSTTRHTPTMAQSDFHFLSSLSASLWRILCLYFSRIPKSSAYLHQGLVATTENSNSNSMNVKNGLKPLKDPGQSNSEEAPSMFRYWRQPGMTVINSPYVLGLEMLCSEAMSDIEPLVFLLPSTTSRTI